MPAKKKNLKFKKSAAKQRMILVVLSVTLMGVAFLAQSLAFRSVGISVGTFNAYCDFSHRSGDDPIVFPGQVNAAHSHDFFGATTLNAFSTTQSIQQGGTSCQRFTGNAVSDRADKSAYWVPTLYVNDQPVTPNRLTAQYKSDFRLVRSIEPFPAGLQMIAGSSTGGPSTPPGSPNRIWYFMCHLSPTINAGSETSAPTCEYHTKNQARLQLVIRFPDCWDGVNLDSANHKSHMAYSSGRTSTRPYDVCPSTHPRMMPAMQIILEYPTTGGPTTRLSSGDTTTAHADFMNGWDQAKLTALVIDCLRIDNYCGGSDKPVPGHAGNEPDPPSPTTATTQSGKSQSASSGSSSASGNKSANGGNGSAASGNKSASVSYGSQGDTSSSAYQTGAETGGAQVKLNPVQAIMNRVGGTQTVSTFYKVAFLIGLTCFVAAAFSGQLTPVTRRLLSRFGR